MQRIIDKFNPGIILVQVLYSYKRILQTISISGAHSDITSVNVVHV